MSRGSIATRETTYAFATVLVGLLATAFVWSLLRDSDAAVADARLRADALQVEVALRHQFSEAAAVLHDIGSLLTIDPEVSADEFRRFVTPILARHSFLRALSWNPRVPGAERSAHERAARRAEVPDYRITERSPSGGLVPAAPREEYVVVRFIEPLAGNRAALGFDVASESRRAHAIRRAAESGEVSVTEAITLVQRPVRGDGVLAFLPVFEGAGLSTGSPRGFVVAVLSLGQMTEAALERHGAPGLTAELFAGASLRSERAPGLPLRRQFSWGDRPWRLEFGATDTYIATNRGRLSEAAIGVGTVFTFLLAAPVLALAARASRLRREVAQRMEAERALRASEERLALIVGVVAEGLWDWNVETGDVYFSESWKAALGYGHDEVPPRVEFWESIVHPDDLPHVRATLRAHLLGRTPVYEVENRLKCADGRWRWNLDRGRVVERDAEGRPLRMVGVDRDITERKLAEEQSSRHEQKLRDTQRLESLGVLAGGIAHDFNNLLAGILGNASLLREPGVERERETALVAIEEASRRAADLCRQLLAYAGRTATSPQPLDLNALLVDSLQLIETSMSRRARLELDLGEGLPAVEGDPAQLRQVFLNLIINAAEACEESGDLVGVSTRRERISASMLEKAVVSGAQPGSECVVLKIEDDGCGMNDEVRSRLFEPFFTTKFTGRGLGLSAVLGIVRAHQGALLLDTVPSEGSTFELLLPVSSEIHEEAKPPESDASYPGTGLVFVVDDEDMVRTTSARMLSSLGFEVEAFSEGAEVIARLESVEREVACVLLDLTMPGMDGAETLAAIRGRFPSLPVVMTSGFDLHEALERTDAPHCAAFLSKPFGVSDLRAAMARARRGAGA